MTTSAKQIVTRESNSANMDGSRPRKDVNVNQFHADTSVQSQRNQFVDSTERFGRTLVLYVRPDAKVMIKILATPAIRMIVESGSQKNTDGMMTGTLIGK